MKAGPASIRHTTYTVRRGSQALPSQGQMADKGESNVCLIRRMVAKENGMRRHLVGLNLVMACLLSAAVSAQESDLAAGKLLYQDNCGTCHGMLESDAKYHVPGEPLWQRVQAGIMPSAVLQWPLVSGKSVYAHRRRALRRPEIGRAHV